MLFNSTDFLIFLPFVAIIYYVIPHKAKYLKNASRDRFKIKLPARQNFLHKVLCVTLRETFPEIETGVFIVEARPVQSKEVTNRVEINHFAS